LQSIFESPDRKDIINIYIVNVETHYGGNQCKKHTLAIVCMYYFGIFSFRIIGKVSSTENRFFVQGEQVSKREWRDMEAHAHKKNALFWKQKLK